MRPPSVLLLLVLSSLVFGQLEPFDRPNPQNAKARVKDIARVQGADSYFLEGIGLVVGLPGTGDSPKELTQKLEAAWLRYRNKIEVTPKDLANKNAAIVSVSAELPAFQQPGTRIDVHVASIADAKSLRGGQLLITKLYGPRSISETDEFFATAQGPLQIDGGGAGNLTTATIPRGAIVRTAPKSTIFERLGGTQHFTLVLRRADWNVANAISSKINALALGVGESIGTPEDRLAQVLDAGRVRVEVPARTYGDRAEEFVAYVLEQEVLLGSPHEPEAAVVINERTGTYSVTGYVTVSPGTVQKGNVAVTIPYEKYAPPANPNARPLRYPNNQDTTVYLVDILDNLSSVGFGAADIIDLLKQMDRAGMINGSVRSE